MSNASIGVQIGATTPPAELGAVVAEAEQLGYREIWLAENYFELGGIASVANALAATEQIPIGLGVIAAATRHPAVAAMEFATLGDMFPGRFMAGIGHGAPGWVRQMGLQPQSPLGLLRESADAIRRLLEGGEAHLRGEYFKLDQVRLLHQPQGPIPLYFGVQGPASLRLSGELADGTVLGWFSSPGYVAYARNQIEEGRSRVDRRSPHELVALCVLSISDEDPVAARRQLARWAAPMLASMGGSAQLKRSGVDPSAFDQPLPDALLSDFVAAGDTASCMETIDRLLSAGADRVVLVPNPAGMRTTEDMVDQICAASSLVRTQISRG